jgi:hypothetical protein
MTSESEKYGSPWYKNSWPWFIVGLLTFSVVGSLLTVAIAYRTRDIDVRKRPPIEAPTGFSASGQEARDVGH